MIMNKWVIGLILAIILFGAVVFRYDVTAVNTSSGIVAYKTDRWTGKTWIIAGNQQALVNSQNIDSAREEKTIYLTPGVENSDAIITTMQELDMGLMTFDALSNQEKGMVVAWALFKNRISIDQITKEGREALYKDGYDEKGYVRSGAESYLYPAYYDRKFRIPSDEAAREGFATFATTDNQTSPFTPEEVYDLVEKGYWDKSKLTEKGWALYEQGRALYEQYKQEHGLK